MSLKISDAQFARAIKDLGDYVAIPSVSHPTSPYYKMETLIQSAEWPTQQLRDMGFEVKVIRIQDSSPFVIAQKIVDAKLSTVMFYHHADVQPVDEDKWETKPFVLTEKNGRLYGRGASDDKAGGIAALAAVRAIQEAGKGLPCNVKFLIETEEEYGSDHMEAFVAQEKEALQADALVVIDGASRNKNVGGLTSATRGIVKMDLKVTALKQPVHSGVGCMVPDPNIALAALVASLANPERIPGFMEGAVPLTDEERKRLKETSVTAKECKEANGVVPSGQLRTRLGQSVYEYVMEAPNISVLNYNSGKPKGGNSIQDVASCEVNARLVRGQKPHIAAEAIERYLRNQPVLGHLPLARLS